MPLVELNPGTSDWQDVKHAALILWRASQISDVTALQNDLRNYDTISAPTIINLHTGINRTRKAILINDQDTITIAFEGSTDDEILVNLWTDGKGPNWWNLPYPVYVYGNRVHSFYLDMWNGMKSAVFCALSDAVATMQDHSIVPKKIDYCWLFHGRRGEHPGFHRDCGTCPTHLWLSMFIPSRLGLRRHPWIAYSTPHICEYGSRRYGLSHIAQ
ncbi:hypothetical protein BCIN_09g07080 [Botrytis cinerea B05.10]|uniref:Uncharacterized protein n=1 Tax=Botryotinia fuckeliana (strain B05.10) TaxID=332648 RepID=A0A384JTW7_BOTFB|nr:hypothetical protein BCIN_09g07080 [Botrytis cinerea B05.10]XP_024551142.1 hypothetical protein BCIN_09g07080 [Botrytis cinerea B05.10]ATZ53960.1 hypothetical protein BCIN_09g07080 [Botrytis cinerea B05.10]ATZ53961.1 hypothetical protein BCIN_09g07080 [Botrytis cinerea B05.10]